MSHLLLVTSSRGTVPNQWNCNNQCLTICSSILKFVTHEKKKHFNMYSTDLNLCAIVSSSIKKNLTSVVFISFNFFYSRFGKLVCQFIFQAKQTAFAISLPPNVLQLGTVGDRSKFKTIEFQFLLKFFSKTQCKDGEKRAWPNYISRKWLLFCTYDYQFGYVFLGNKGFINVLTNMSKIPTKNIISDILNVLSNM